MDEAKSHNLLTRLFRFVFDAFFSRAKRLALSGIGVTVL